MVTDQINVSMSLGGKLMNNTITYKWLSQQIIICNTNRTTMILNNLKFSLPDK